MIFASTDPTLIHLSLHLPVFIQDRGPEAYKFSEILVSITPRGTATEEITSKISSQLGKPMLLFYLYPAAFKPPTPDFRNVSTNL